MSANESVTQWMLQLQQGDDRAAERLWERFFSRMLVMARARLHHRVNGVSDEEDIALSAFHSFCEGLRNGRFDELQGRDSLWRLLVVITTRKVADQHVFNRRKKRDVSREIRLEAVNADDESMIRLISREPTPQMELELSEQLSNLLDGLAKDDLKNVALLKMEGYTNEEVAVQLGKSLSTVERKLRTIRAIWGRIAADSEATNESMK